MKTAIGDALQKAGVNTAEHRLFVLATKQLHVHNLDSVKAVPDFVKAVRDDPDLLVELFTYAALRVVALRYLDKARNQMNSAKAEGAVQREHGESQFRIGRAQNSPQGDGGVQAHPESHRRFGPSDNSVPAQAGDGVLSAPESLDRAGAVDSLPPQGGAAVHVRRESHELDGGCENSVPSQEGGSVHIDNDRHIIFGAPEKSEGGGSIFHVKSQPVAGPSPSPQVLDGAVHKLPVDGHRSAGRAVQKPHLAPRGLAAMKAAKEATKPIFDRIIIRGGMPIGDVVWSALPRLIGQNAKEAAMLWLISRYGEAPPNARVRDVLSAAELQRVVDQAEKMSSVETLAKGHQELLNVR